MSDVASLFRIGQPLRYVAYVTSRAGEIEMCSITDPTHPALWRAEEGTIRERSVPHVRHPWTACKCSSEMLRCVLPLAVVIKEDTGLCCRSIRTQKLENFLQLYTAPQGIIMSKEQQNAAIQSIANVSRLLRDAIAAAIPGKTTGHFDMSGHGSDGIQLLQSSTSVSVWYACFSTPSAARILNPETASLVPGWSLTRELSSPAP